MSISCFQRHLIRPSPLLSHTQNACPRWHRLSHASHAYPCPIIASRGPATVLPKICADRIIGATMQGKSQAGSMPKILGSDHTDAAYECTKTCYLGLGHTLFCTEEEFWLRFCCFSESLSPFRRSCRSMYELSNSVLVPDMDIPGWGGDRRWPWHRIQGGVRAWDRDVFWWPSLALWRTRGRTSEKVSQ